MRTLVVGDVHGCLEELDQLLAEAGFRPHKDRLILAGDLVDRGPDPRGVIRRACELGAEAVLGNHEERHLRFRQHELRRRVEPSHRSSMRPFSAQRQKEHDSFEDEDWRWLESLPLSIRIDSRWVVVHAGLEPGIGLEEQKPNTLLRMRYVRRSDGRMASVGEDLSQPADSDPWWQRWSGPESVLFGHQVYAEPRRSEPGPGVLCLGIDTGCCFGGQLTAAVLEGGELVELVQVRAREAYQTSSAVCLPLRPAV